MDWSALAATFGLIFVAELGDKTQLAVVTQTCKYRQPWAVFLGASLALIAVTALGAAGGGLLARLLPEGVLGYAAAAAFIVMGILVGREALRARSDEGACEPTVDCADEVGEAGRANPGRSWDWKAFASTLGLLFVAEMGDKTQLAVLGLAGRSEAPWLVFSGGALALVVVTALGVVGGQGLTRLLPERALLWASAGAFVVLGALMGLGVL